MNPGVTAWIGLGSNLDGPRRQVARGLQALETIPGSHVIRRSPLYGSKPMGPAGQPDYVNAVAAIETALDPWALLDELQRIEAEAGRERGGARWGPRTLDLDLLLHGDRTIRDARLIVPHPGIAERPFVLVPLARVAPELSIPGGGTVAELAAAVDTGVVWALEEHPEAG
jgi:2-amino-4-hydroxy-6-hydroxymethyldihydropteridine diphosphokinase